jgi:hypothetical protein
VCVCVCVCARAYAWASISPAPIACLLCACGAVAALDGVSRRYQQCLLGEFAAASESYRQASKLDESNVSALAGMIYCQICEGQYEDAEQQLELFRMIQESVGRTSELAFLDALLAW